MGIHVASVTVLPPEPLAMPLHLFTFSPAQEGFSRDCQRRLVDAAYDAQRTRRFACAAALARADRLEVLVAWDDPRDAEALAAALRETLERAVRQEFGSAAVSGGRWLAAETANRRVRNRVQYEWLLERLSAPADGCAWTWPHGIRVAAEGAQTAA